MSYLLFTIYLSQYIDLISLGKKERDFYENFYIQLIYDSNSILLPIIVRLSFFVCTFFNLFSLSSLLRFLSTSIIETIYHLSTMANWWFMLASNLIHLSTRFLCLIDALVAAMEFASFFVYVLLLLLVVV